MGASERRQAWRAVEVLRPRDRDRVDSAPRLQPTSTPDRRLSELALRDDGRRSRRTGPHHAISARPAPRAWWLRRVPVAEAIHLIVDSTGLTIVGEGEWAAAKHGSRGRRGWRKLHLGVDGSGVIVAQILTDGRVDDAATVPGLLDQVEDGISVFTADTAYDARAVSAAARKRGAMVVIPPTRAARARTRPRCPAREMTVARVKEIGRMRWKKESGYHQQARVENAFFRYKSIIGIGFALARRRDRSQKP